MSYHEDREVNDSLIRFLDALCEFERGSGKGSTLLLIPHNREDELVMAQDGKPISSESITPEFLFASAMRLYRPGEPAGIIKVEIQGAREFAFIEVDQIANLEEEFVLNGRPYPAFLMRKVLNLVKPNWKDEHPQYKYVSSLG